MGWLSQKPEVDGIKEGILLLPSLPCDFSADEQVGQRHPLPKARVAT